MHSTFSIFQFSLFHTKIDQSSPRVVETTPYPGYIHTDSPKNSGRVGRKSPGRAPLKI